MTNKDTALKLAIEAIYERHIVQEDITWQEMAEANMDAMEGKNNE